MSLISDEQAQQAQDGGNTNNNSQNNADKKGNNLQSNNADSLYYLAPLNGFDPKDMTGCISDINEQLTVFSKDIYSLSQIASSPVNGNLFASVSATGMLLDKLSDSPASGKDYSALAIDLLGCLIGEDAQIATVLRPILHKVRDAYLRQPKNIKENPLKASDLKLFDDHMHTLKAGELKTLIEKSQAKLGGWLTQAGSLGKDSLQALIQPATPAESAKQPAPVSSNSGKNWYAPDKTYPSIWQALQSVTKQEKAKPNATGVTSLASIATPSTANTPLTTKISKLQAALAKEIKAQSGTKEGLVGFYLQKLLEALKEHEIVKTTVVVEGQPARVIEEKKEGIIEALAKVAPTENCPDCSESECNTQVGGTISLALGEEIIQQTDYVLPGSLSLIWGRTYRSNLLTYSKGEMGARWINEYTVRIDIRKNEWLFNTSDGRILKLPKLKVGDIYRHPSEKFNLIYLDDELISITYGKHRLELFQKHGNNYKLIAIKKNADSIISLSYDNQHRLALVNNQANGHCLTSNYNSNHQITQVHLHQIDKDTQTVGDRIKIVAQYEYDKKGNLISAIDENKDKRTFEYDDYHRITRYTDRTGFGMNLQWQGRRHKARAFREYADNGSRELNLKWNDKLRSTKVTNALGQSVLFFCDINGYPVRTIYPDGREEWFFRDANKNIIKHLTPDGRAVSSTYDWKSNLLSTTQNDSSKTFFEYNEKDQLIKTVDANGHQWRNQYDANGNLVKSINPKGHVTQYEYNDQALLSKVTDPRGGINTFSYNGSGQIIKETDCSNKSSGYGYNSKGQMSFTKDAKDHTLQYEYNERGQGTRVVYPDGQFQQSEYEAEGRLLNIKDGMGRVTKTDYDTGYVPHRVTDPLGRQITTKTDPLGQVTLLTDANGSHYRWYYHPQTNQLLKETSFSGKNTQYQYDSNTGELIQSQEDGGKPIRYEYDERGRLSKRHTDKLTEQYIYDQMGQLIIAKNFYSKNQYFYDEVGNLIKEIQDITRIGESDKKQKLSRQYIWQYEYDVLGNRTATIRPDGQRVDYLTYGSGHIHGVLLNQQPLVDYERDDIHREVSKSFGNQIEQQYQFDKTGYLQQQKLTGKLEQQKDYIYNKQGLIRQISDLNKGTQTYEYDLVGRLIHARNKDSEERFYFDPANNRLDPLSVTSQQTDNTHNYNLESRFPNSHATADYRARADINYKKNKGMGNLLTEFNGSQYEYDLSGNLIKKVSYNDTIAYEWNDFNQLSKLSNNKGTTHYRYDPMGRRIYKRFECQENKNTNSYHPQHSYTETYYIWEGDTLALEETNKQIKHYLYEPDSFVPLVQFLTDEQNKPTQLYFYHNDHIGTPEMMTDKNGTIVWEGTKTAFGEMTEISRVQGLKNPIRFPGQYYDEESGLHYNRHRYYEPETGKYLSEDPIKLAGGMNLYDYPQNPVEQTDSLGLYTIKAQYFGEQLGFGFNVNGKGKCLSDYGKSGFGFGFGKVVGKALGPVYSAPGTIKTGLLWATIASREVKIPCSMKKDFEASLEAHFKAGHFKRCKTFSSLKQESGCVDEAELKSFLKSFYSLNKIQGNVDDLIRDIKSVANYNKPGGKLKNNKQVFPGNHGDQMRKYEESGN